MVSLVRNIEQADVVDHLMEPQAYVIVSQLLRSTSQSTVREASRRLRAVFWQAVVPFQTHVDEACTHRAPDDTPKRSKPVTLRCDKRVARILLKSTRIQPIADRSVFLFPRV